MEWINQAATLVSQVGFPIAACCGIFVLLYKQMKDTEKRDAEYRAVLMENTMAINSLRDLVQTLHKEE